MRVSAIEPQEEGPGGGGYRSARETANTYDMASRVPDSEVRATTRLLTRADAPGTVRCARNGHYQVQQASGKKEQVPRPATIAERCGDPATEWPAIGTTDRDFEGDERVAAVLTIECLIYVYMIKCVFGRLSVLLYELS